MRRRHSEVNPPPPASLQGADSQLKSRPFTREQSNLIFHQGPSKEFKLQKKIAELTQVVHMLFQANHLHETQLARVKDACSEEVDRLIKLHSQLLEAEHDQLNSANTLIQRLEEEKKSLNAELATVQYELRELRKSSSELHGRANISQDQLDDLRGSHVRLAQELRDTQACLVDKSAETQRLLEDLASSRSLAEQLRVSLAQANAKLQQSESKLQAENSKLLQTIESLKAEANDKSKRIKELELLQRKFEEKPRPEFTRSSTNIVKKPAPPVEEDRLELERLRAEVKRLKLELSNRESNFNRIFSEAQPVLVPSMPSSGAMRTSHDNRWLPSIHDGGGGLPAKSSGGGRKQSIHVSQSGRVRTSTNLQSHLSVTRSAADVHRIGDRKM